MQSKSQVLIISLISLTVFTGCFLVSSQTTQAIGISPPAVINHQLSRGSHFEQRIYINQGNPQIPLRATANINVPEKIKDWITFKPGTEFIIPLVKLFPVFVEINVPADADFGGYGGEINISTQPEELKKGQVAISLGLTITLDLAVVEEEIIDFNFVSQEVKPMEDGWPVKLILTIDNRGNIGAKPEKVFLEVHNRRDGSFLGSGEVTSFNPSHVEPFKKSSIIAEFAIKLPEGLYWAQGKIYKTEDEIIEYKFPFDVLEEGALPREKPWLKWLLIGLGAVAFLGIVVWLWRKTSKKILALFSLIMRLRPSLKIKEKKAAKKKQVKKAKKVSKKDKFNI